jgi:hypothetical protein
MKKIIILTALVVVNYLVNAQTGRDNYSFNSKKMKGDIIAYINSIEESSVSVADVNEKAKKSFSKNYTSASFVQWAELENKEAMCTFYQENVLARAFYDKNGNWKATIKSYDAKQFSKNLQHIVKMSYPEFDILGGQEITFPDNPPVYIIMIQDDESLFKLKVANEDVTILHKFRRSN